MVFRESSVGLVGGGGRRRRAGGAPSAPPLRQAAHRTQRGGGVDGDVPPQRDGAGELGVGGEGRLRVLIERRAAQRAPLHRARPLAAAAAALGGGGGARVGGVGGGDQAVDAHAPAAAPAAAAAAAVVVVASPSIASERASEEAARCRLHLTPSSFASCSLGSRKLAAESDEPDGLKSA